MPASLLEWRTSSCTLETWWLKEKVDYVHRKQPVNKSGQIIIKSWVKSRETPFKILVTNGFTYGE